MAAIECFVPLLSGTTITRRHLERFCDDREVTDEFAAPAEVACDCNALALGPGLAE